LLISLYRHDVQYTGLKRIKGIQKSAGEGHYRGRQRIPLDLVTADQVFKAFRLGLITESEALEKLGISRSTFYRRLKEAVAD